MYIIFTVDNKNGDKPVATRPSTVSLQFMYEPAMPTKMFIEKSINSLVSVIKCIIYKTNP